MVTIITKVMRSIEKAGLRLEKDISDADKRNIAQQLSVSFEYVKRCITILRKQYACGIYRKAQFVDYVDLNKVTEAVIEKKYLVCPDCKHEHWSVPIISSKAYIELFEKNVPEAESVWYCEECKRVFSDEEHTEDKWVSRQVNALVCPKCSNVTAMTPENKSVCGFVCPFCRAILRYTANPSHGSGRVKLEATSDYFHGVCPNCMDGIMILEGELFIQGSRLIIPLECTKCRYRDTVKIVTGKDRTITVSV